MIETFLTNPYCLLFYGVFIIEIGFHVFKYHVLTLTSLIDVWKRNWGFVGFGVSWDDELLSHMNLVNFMNTHPISYIMVGNVIAIGRLYYELKKLRLKKNTTEQPVEQNDKSN